jgi:maltose O-acetyltransferase
MKKFLKKVFKLLAKYSLGNRFRIFFLHLAGYQIGKDAYVGEDLIIIDELEDKGQVVIGDRVAIAPRVTLVASSRPNFSRIGNIVSEEKGPIIIEDDAWLGTGAIVMPNVRIGEGAVVGAGSVVTKDVPPYTVVVGSPARALKKVKSVSGENE